MGANPVPNWPSLISVTRSPLTSAQRSVSASPGSNPAPNTVMAERAGTSR